MSKSVQLTNTDRIKKFTERLAENRHTPDLVLAFSNENGRLIQVLPHAEPPIYTTTSVD